jgi:hypothetical protein
LRVCVVYSGGGDVHENAHSDGYGCRVFRLHFIGTAFDASSGSGEPGGSGRAAECGVSRHASFTSYAKFTSYACGAGYARSARGSSAAGKSC